MVNGPHNVLVVDDEPDVARLHAQMLRALGSRPRVQTDPEKVESQLLAQPDIQLVLLDIRMPHMDGLELLRRIKLRAPHVGVVMATVVNDIEHAVTATKSGAYNYLLKPLQTERVREVVDSYFANRPQLLTDDPRFSSFITACPAFQPIFRAIQAFAEADVPVLIQGETGTGKELVAQLVHALSARNGEKFLPVNTAALTPGLFESELFGHKRGAFTGAVADSPGYFEAAGKGTLFLDEIGEVAPEQQVKLLRALQSFQYCRVGETRERPLEARLVMATNRDMHAEVRDQRFRADLFYRLSGHTILLPPLRERPGDVELLAQYMLRKYATQFGRSLEGFHPDTLATLRRYSFPGNVRELDGIVSGAVLLETGPLVMPASLPRHVKIEEDGDLDLEGVRYRTISAALASCNGNQTAAAKKLGMSRGHLNRLLRQFRETGAED